MTAPSDKAGQVRLRHYEGKLILTGQWDCATVTDPADIFHLLTSVVMAGATVRDVNGVWHDPKSEGWTETLMLWANELVDLHGQHC